MSSSIDERIVSLKMENKQFEKNAAQSIDTLDKLKKSMDVKESAKSLKSLSRASKSVNFSGLEKSIGNIEKRFSALGIAGMTAIQDVTRFAMRGGKQIASYLTKPLEQIKSGGINRAMNIEQATFQLKGMGLAWKEVRQNALDAVRGTAYGLDEAVKVASQLGASGVKAGKDMQNSLTGIAGVAAMTGRSYSDIGDIFATVASNGKVMTQQLRQLSSSGLNASATMAKYFGMTEEKINDLVSHGKISFDQFNAAMQAAFGSHAKEANETFSGALSNVKASLSRIGEGPATAGLEALRKLFVSLIPVIDGFNDTLQPLLKDLSKVITYVGGFFTALMQNKSVVASLNNIIKGMTGVFRFLGNVMKTVGKAFLDVFPPKSITAVLQMTRNFKNFGKNLKLSEEAAETLRTVARGLFATFGILKNVLTLVVHVLRDIAKSPVGSFIMKVVKWVSNLIVNIEYFLRVLIAGYDYTVQYFGGLAGVFQNFGIVIVGLGSLLGEGFKKAAEKVVDVISKIKEAITSLIPGFGTAKQGVEKVGDAAKGVAEKASKALMGTGDKAKAAAQKTADAVKTVGNAAAGVAKKTEDAAKASGEAAQKQAKDTSVAAKAAEAAAAGVQARADNAVKQAEQQQTGIVGIWGKVLNGITAGIRYVTIGVTFLWEKLSDVFGWLIGQLGHTSLSDIFKALFAFNFSNLIGSVTKGLQSIEGSISGFFDSFSKIQTGRIKQIENINKIFENVKNTLGAFQKSIRANMLIKLAVAIGVLAAAILLVSKINLKELINGLAAVTILMAELLVATAILKKINKNGGIQNSAAVIFTMIAVAEGVKILAKAVVALSALNIGQVGTALLAMAGSLLILMTSMSIMRDISAKRMFSVAMSIIEVSLAIKVMGSAIKQLGSMDIYSVVVGLATMFLALQAIASFSNSLEKINLDPKFGFAIIELGIAIGIISKAIVTMGQLNFQQMATSLVGLGVMLYAIAKFADYVRVNAPDLSPKFGFTLIEIGLALKIIASAMDSIGSIPFGNAVQGLASMSIMLYAISLFAEKVNDNSDKITVRFGLSMIAVATALRIVASAVAAIGALSIQQAATGVLSLIVVIYALAKFAETITKKGEAITKSTMAMIGIGVAMKKIAEGLNTIGQLNVIQIAAATASMYIVMKAFAEFSNQLNEFDLWDLAGAVTMIPLIGNALNTVASAMQRFAGLSVTEAVTGVVTFAATMVIFKKAIDALCKKPADGSVSITSLGWTLNLIGGGILSMATSIATMGKMPLKDVATGLVAFGGALAILSAGLKTMDLSKGNVGGFLVLTLAVAILAAPLILLAHLDFGGVAAGLIMFGGAITILAVASKILNKQIVPMLKMIGVLALFAATMLLLAPSFTLLGNVPMVGIAGALVAIAGSLTILGVAAKILGPRVKDMERICGVIAKMSRGFLILSTAVGIFALTLAAIASGLIAKGLGEGLKGLAQAISDSATSIANAAKDIVIAIVNALKESIPYLVDSAFEMILKFIQGCSDAIQKYLPIIMSALGTLLASVAKALKKWFAEFDSVGTDLAIKIGAAVVAILAVIRSIVKSTSALNPKNFKSLLIIAGLIVASVIALYVLAGIPWQRLLAATASYSATLFSLAGAMKIMAGTEFNKNQIIAFAEAIALVVAIGASLYFLAQQPWESVLAGAAGLVACLLGFSAAFKIASSAQPDLVTIALFLLGSLAFIPIGAALILVAKQPWESILAAGAALVGALLAFGAVFAVISLIPLNLANTALFLLGTLAVLPIAFALNMVASSADFQAITAAGAALCNALLSFGAVFAIMALIPASLAANAVASIAVALGGLIGILVVLGALNQIPGFSWLIDEGGKIVKKLGKIIGGFFGAIVAGFAEEAASCLPVVGQSLSDFMTNAQPFFDAVTKLDEGTLESVKMLADAILTLTEASLMSAIGDMFSFFTGESAFDSLGVNLVKFGHAMADFSDATSDIVPENISLLAEAAKNLATALDVLPKEGGLAQWFSGTTDYDKLGGQLKSFGKAMTEMSTSVEELDLDAVEKVKGAGEMMAAMADAAPKYGGVFQAFTGETDMARFGRDVTSFGKAMAQLSNDVKGDIDLKAVESIKNAGDMMSNMADKAPSYGGVFQMFTGESDLGQFGRQIVSFGVSMKNFSHEVSDLDAGAVKNAAAVGDMLVALVNGLPESGGVVGWWSGDKDLEDLGEQLVPFANYLVEFGNQVKTLDHSAIYDSANAMMNMAKLFTTVSDVNAAGQVGPFCENMKSVGDAYSIFNGDINSIDSTKIETFCENLKLLLTTFSKKFKTKGVDYKKIAEFSRNIKSLNTAMGFITGENASSIESFNDSLKQLAEIYTGFAKDIKTVKTKDIKEFVKQVKTLMTAFEKKKGSVKMDFGNLSGFAKNISTISKSAKQLSGKGAGNVDNFKSNLESLGKIYKEFAEKVRTVEDTDITNFGTQAKNLAEIAKKLKKVDSKGLKDFGKAISDVGEGGNKAMDKALESVGKKLKSFTGKGKAIITNMANGIKSQKAVKSLTNAVKKVLGDARVAANEYRDRFKETGLYVIHGFVEGFKTNSSFDMVSEAAKNIAKAAVKAMKKELEVKSPSRVMAQLGRYSTEGFAKGLTKDTKEVKAAATEVANANIEGITETLQIHSPSLAGFKLGEFSVDGFIQGLKSKASEVVKASSGVGDGFLGGLTKALDIKGAIKGATKKDKKNMFAGLGKDMGKDLTKELSGKSGGGSGGGGGGNVNPTVKKAVEKWTKAESFKQGFLTAFIKGFKMSKTMLAKEIGTTTKNAGKLLSEFNKQVKAIDKDLAKFMVRNPKAVANYTKAINNTKKYIKNFVSSINGMVKNGLSNASTISSKVVSSFADRLYKGSKEYKTSMKNIKKYTEEQKKLEAQTDKYNKKIAAARKKKNNKQAKEYLKKLEELSTKTKENRKKINNEWKKVGEGAGKALKAMQKEIKSTLREIVKFGDFNLEDSRIVSGLEAISDTTEELEDKTSMLESSYDFLSVAIDEATESTKDSTDAAKEAADAYDGLSQSMDTGIDLMERFSKVGATEAEALFENADSQLEAYAEFQRGIEELERKGLDMSIVDQLASEGPQALSKIRGFLSMSDDQIRSYNKRVDKQNEYAVKALERNLKRQYEVYKKFREDLEKLGLMLGDNNAVYIAFHNAGLSNADMLSKILGIDDSSAFNNIIDFIAKGIGTGLETLNKDGTIQNETKNSGEEASKTWIEGWKEGQTKSNAFEEGIKEALDLGLNPRLATWILAQGYEAGQRYLDGMSNSIEVDGIKKNVLDKSLISEANDIWEKSGGNKSWLDDVEESEKQLKQLSDIGEKAKEAGLDEDFIKWVKDKGYEDGMRYFEGLMKANDKGEQEFTKDLVDKANEYWKKYGTKKQTEATWFDNIQNQVDAQALNKSENAKLKSNFSEFLKKWAIQNAGQYSQSELADKIYGYEQGFGILVEELKAKGLDANEILVELNKWLTDDKEGWGKITTTLDNLNKRSTNNAEYTAEAVRESWNKKVQNLKDRTNAMITITKKFGSKMSTALYNEIKDWDLEQLKALASEEFTSEDLQAMADEWYDAEYAAESLADSILSSVINGTEQGMKDARVWISEYAKTYKNKNKSDKGTSEDFIYEIGTYMKAKLAEGKGLKEIITEINELSYSDPEQFKKLFNFSAADIGTAKSYISKLTKYIYESDKKHMSDEDMIADLLSSKNSIKDFVGEKILGGILQTGIDVKGFLKTTVTDPLSEEADRIAQDAKNTSTETGAAIASVRETIIDEVTTATDADVANGASNLSSAINSSSDKAVDLSKSSVKGGGYKLGKTQNTGVAKGITENTYIVVSKVKDAVETVRKQCKDPAYQMGFELGRNICNGLAAGIYNGQSNVISAAVDTAVAAYNAARAALKIKSPSRKFMEIGKFVDEGFALGIQNNSGLVSEAMIDMNESTLDGMRKAIMMANDAINGDLELAPTITPTLDLSLARKQASRANDLFNAYSGIGIVGDDANLASTNQNGANSVTFVQNNYSPKALDRLEIYRQTNNQFAMARKAVTGNA